MRPTVFDDLLEKRIVLIRDVLAKKQDEYATDDDVLHNFKKAAAMSRTSEAGALWGMLVKHLVSIKDLVDDHGAPELDKVDEKIGDAINYLILLEAIFKERSRDLR